MQPLLSVKEHCWSVIHEELLRIDRLIRSRLNSDEQ